MRREHRKLRTGCKQCRRRKVKCDEGKPSCAGCIRNKLQCSFEFLTPSLPRPYVKSARSDNRSSSTEALPCTSPWQDLNLQISPLDLHRLELLHHYTSTTCFTFGDERSMYVWQKEIPQMAISHEFLMHGLLAISALHLSTLQPHRQSELTQRARISEHLSLPSFRDFVTHDDPQNIHAVFAFASFVVPYVIMVCGSHSSSTERIPNLDDEYPHWFFAFRGLLQMLARSWMALKKGPFSPLLKQSDVAVEYGTNPDDVYLAKIHGFLENRAHSSDDNFENLTTYKSALDELRRVFALPQSPLRTRVMIAVHVWPGTVSQQFIDLMQQRRPEALVILAHYCVLLKKVDSSWWLKGVGSRLLAAIEMELGSKGRPWIEWALEYPEH